MRDDKKCRRISNKERLTGCVVANLVIMKTKSFKQSKDAYHAILRTSWNNEELERVFKRKA